MKLRRSWVMLAAGFILLPDTRIGFRPEEGTVLVKRFELNFDGALEDVRIRLNGGEFGIGEWGIDIGFLQRLRTTDEYVSMGQGRPEELRRSYDEIRRVTTVDDEERQGLSELDGETVMFTWDEEEESFLPRFEGSDVRRSLLEGLVEDTDLRLLLPADEVVENETWTVDARELSRLFFPGGDLKIEEEEDGWGDLFRRIADSLEGEIVLGFLGTEREGGSRAIIRIEGDASGKGKLEECTHSGPVTLEFEVELRLEGELVWDLDGGHFRALELECDLEGNMKGSFEFPWGKEDGFFEWTAIPRFYLTFTASATTEDC
ncbi:MAG: hypothetical protein O7B99_14935 [Planctomycetota bacterium]|nr:hypothetical protein [Planctomycetota bacterium]